MNFRIIALDPGGTTGWATYSANRIEGGVALSDWMYEYYNEEWSCGQLGPDDHHVELDDLLSFQRVQNYLVVCESFEFRGGAAKARDNLNLMSKEYIGVMKRFCKAEEVPYRMQTASMAKGLVTDDKIRKAGLWYPNQKHAMDATRHLLYILVTGYQRDDLVKRWWRPASAGR